VLRPGKKSAKQFVADQSARLGRHHQFGARDCSDPLFAQQHRSWDRSNEPKYLTAGSFLHQRRTVHITPRVIEEKQLIVASQARVRFLSGMLEYPTPERYELRYVADDKRPQLVHQISGSGLTGRDAV
jgi:hypothetical protein